MKVTILLMLLSPVLGTTSGADAGEVAGQSPCSDAGLDERTQAGCDRAAAALDKLIREQNFEEAFELLRKLNDALGLFQPYRGQCWGTLNGGACTVDQSAGQRARELYSNPKALAPRWLGWSGLVSDLNEARLRRIAEHHQAVREALARGDVDSAQKEFAKTARLGDDDEQFATDLREAAFVAQGRQMLEGAPAFEDEGVRWYRVPTYNPRIVPIGNKCKQLFGEEADRAPVPYSEKRVRCAISQSRPLAEAELVAARDALQKEEKRPPTARKSRPEVWLKVADSLPGALACPSGMKSRREIDARSADSCMEHPYSGATFEDRWSKCVGANPPNLVIECEAFMSSKDYCPSGKYDGNICLIEQCLPGTTPLAEPSDGLIEGCYRCPVGALDLVQTAAARNRDWEQIRKARQRSQFMELFCRVDPEGRAPAKATPNRKPRR